MAELFYKAIEEDQDEEVAEMISNGVNVNEPDPETGYFPLHKACKAGATKVIKVLCEKGADANSENASTYETPLHLAAATYRDDPDGKIEFEDMIVDLVKYGCMAFPDRNGKMPDAGDDAVGIVAKAMEDAEKAGKPELKERQRLRKEKGEAAFSKAMDDHLNNASACAIVVADSADTEGYKYGSRS
eukprot:CAMPEP_0197858548 /NCGR_PEP_ID=MMETSP1438-20131217/32412_1 /TAXON_ID=1461541 /ORGANISM="Pterosperma sp., Strain CCMP1384" /LENGTH=186 /DNA_ID=CAMNT_0043474741 /DNA_START=29 /DNA_END=589 /DNA_ORIENTATION=+